MKLLLEKLCLAAGVNGVGDVADVIAAELKNYVPQVQCDRLGNVWGVRPAAADNAPVLLLEAHMDEIGFVVTNVTDNGFLRVSACGGVDERILAAQPVTVLTDPPLSGVFCSTPPHIAGANGNMLSAEERGVDIGLSAEKVKETVAVGTRVMFAPHFESLLGDRVCAKALDDRAGCAALLYALKQLQNEVLPFTVVALFAVQEELGTRGAAPAAFAVNPDAAIVVDVSFAHTPDAKACECGVLGKGPMLGISPMLDYDLTEQLRALASSASMPIQYEVMGGSTGTDADKIGVVREGVSTALLSIPLKYMHTPNEVASVSDILRVAELICEFIKHGEVSAHA